jgi:hypothetical protein
VLLTEKPNLVDTVGSALVHTFLPSIKTLFQGLGVELNESACLAYASSSVQSPAPQTNKKTIKKIPLSFGTVHKS